MNHHRRRSGHASGNTSLTDVRKAVTATDPYSKKHSSRPAAMTRRITPQTVPKQRKSPRDREQEEEERWWNEERESFPEYCMICEKQFVPVDDQSLYCSNECRMHDQNSAGMSAVPNRYISSHQAAQYPFYSGPPEPRDIIPRASPSRPSPTQIPPQATPASAISALKSLSIRPASPTSPVGTYHSNMWPFGGRSMTATSPQNSYTKHAPVLYASTYDGTYFGAGGADYYGSSSDRPLPSRRPAAYSRPKSIELVTPMLGR